MKRRCLHFQGTTTLLKLQKSHTLKSPIRGKDAKKLIRYICSLEHSKVYCVVVTEQGLSGDFKANISPKKAV